LEHGKIVEEGSFEHVTDSHAALKNQSKIIEQDKVDSNYV
jgi:hypothetical protein